MKKLYLNYLIFKINKFINIYFIYKYLFNFYILFYIIIIFCFCKPFKAFTF